MTPTNNSQPSQGRAHKRLIAGLLAGVLAIGSIWGGYALLNNNSESGSGSKFAKASCVVSRGTYGFGGFGSGPYGGGETTSDCAKPDPANPTRPLSTAGPTIKNSDGTALANNTAMAGQPVQIVTSGLQDDSTGQPLNNTTCDYTLIDSNGAPVPNFTLTGTVTNGTCTATGNLPTTLPTGSYQPVITIAGPGGNLSKAGDIFNVVPATTPLTPADLANIPVTCTNADGSVVKVSTTTNTCTFTLPAGKTLPPGMTIGIDGATPGGTCTVTGTTVTCTNVPSGTESGTNVPVKGNIGGQEGPFRNGVPVEVPTTVINPATNVGNSTTNECNGGTVVIGTSIPVCSFPLTGAPNNTYALPTTGLTTSISTATGQSNPCTIANNGTANATLECTNIPTTGGQQGPRDVLVSGQDKGNTNLVPNATTIDPATNIGAPAQPCNGGSVLIGSPVTCVYPLQGATNNTYQLPTNGITAQIPGATGNAPCIIANNGTAQASLICANIPTAGATPGTQPVKLNNLDKGSVNLVNSAGECSATKPCFLQTPNYTFTPGSSTTVFGTKEVVLNIKPSVFGASGTGNYMCRIGIKIEGKTDADATYGFGKMTPRLTEGTISNEYKEVPYDNAAGGCKVTLPSDKQLLPKWYYRIQLVEVNNGNVVTQFQAEPSYFLLYGSIGVVNISVTPVDSTTPASTATTTSTATSTAAQSSAASSEQLVNVRPQ